MPGPWDRGSAGWRSSRRRSPGWRFASLEAGALPSRMKKTFQLNIEGKNRDRVLEAVKHEIRKYIKRERGRDVPAGADYWDFDCKFGAAADTAQATHLGNLTGLIDEV